MPTSILFQECSTDYPKDYSYNLHFVLTTLSCKFYIRPTKMPYKHTQRDPTVNSLNQNNQSLNTRNEEDKYKGNKMPKQSKT